MHAVRGREGRNRHRGSASWTSVRGGEGTASATYTAVRRGAEGIQLRCTRAYNYVVLGDEGAEDDEAETEEAAAAHTHNTNTLTVTGSCGSVATTAPRHPGATASYRHEKKRKKKRETRCVVLTPKPGRLCDFGSS